jgi:mRNA interferase MazF
MAMPKLWSPDRSDVIWIDCNSQADKDMKDIHPLLVLSPKAFNERARIVIALPMTTATFNETNPFAVTYAGPQGKVSYILTLDILPSLKEGNFYGATR